MITFQNNITDYDKRYLFQKDDLASHTEQPVLLISNKPYDIISKGEPTNILVDSDNVEISSSGNYYLGLRYYPLCMATERGAFVDNTWTPNGIIEIGWSGYGANSDSASFTSYNIYGYFYAKDATNIYAENGGSVLIYSMSQPVEPYNGVTLVPDTEDRVFYYITTMLSNCTFPNAPNIQLPPQTLYSRGNLPNPTNKDDLLYALLGSGIPITYEITYDNKVYNFNPTLIPSGFRCDVYVRENSDWNVVPQYSLPFLYTPMIIYKTGSSNTSIQPYAYLQFMLYDENGTPITA